MMKERSKGSYDASSVTKMIVWLQNNADKLKNKTPKQAKEMFDKEHNANIALGSLATAAHELGIVMKQRFKSDKPSGRYNRVVALAKAMEAFIDEVEVTIGVKPKTLGQNNGVRTLLDKITGRVKE